MVIVILLFIVSLQGYVLIQGRLSAAGSFSFQGEV
jgi:hypothetical protein